MSVRTVVNGNGTYCVRLLPIVTVRHTKLIRMWYVKTSKIVRSFNYDAALGYYLDISECILSKHVAKLMF